jgi:hypothetical protein
MGTRKRQDASVEKGDKLKTVPVLQSNRVCPTWLSRDQAMMCDKALPHLCAPPP